MKKKYLEAGRCGRPRGLAGEINFDCWCDSPEFLIGLEKLYRDSEGKEFLVVKDFRPHISSFTFEGYDQRNLVSALTGQVLYFDRDDIELEDGVVYNDDLIGLPVFDDMTGERVGTLTRIDEGVRYMLYVIGADSGEEFVLPCIDEFVRSIDINTGIRVMLIDGMRSGGE